MSHPPLGLIEGFFGPPWPEQHRLNFAPFLQKNNFDFYLYAPKADSFLRKKWRDPWSKEYREKLSAYARHFRAHQIQFGVGLSPFELHLLPLAEGRRLLEEKLAQLEECGLDVLGLFFDDMPVHADLAQKQLEAIEVVRNATKAKLIFCPTFYSPDPILEKVFGQKPEKYFEEIRTAPKEVEFAWTGPKVISEDISPEHLDETTELLGRKPFLWDNLFANDGPRNCKFLKIRPPQGRTRQALEKSGGWAWNPMNQAALSRLVMLASRHSILERTAPEFALSQAIQELCSPALAGFLQENRRSLLEEGLDKIEAGQKEKLRAELKPLCAAEPVAAEIDQWLAGAYIVGAECLTD